MSSIAVYPGSFDPVTLGHLSVLARASKLFGSVEVLVVHNPNKTSTFSSGERVALIESSIEELGLGSNISVSSLDSGLLVEHAKKLGAQALIKGFRTAADIEYEIPMAQVNRDLSGIETVFLPSEPGYGYVSSSLVREVASLGGDVTRYLTPQVAKALLERLGK